MSTAPTVVSTPAAPPVRGAEQTYMLSSQARNWRFSARQVEKMRSDGNETARQRLAALWERERSLPAVTGEPEASSSSEPIAFLSLEEEQALITYYLDRVRRLVKAFLLPELVEATAITFIKRFYLRNTCMDFHPKDIMLTCIFLAAKAENNVIPLQHFATKLAGKTPQPSEVAEYTKTVQDLEFLVSQSLSFEYAVHGAHRALRGLMLDLQTLEPAPSKDKLSAVLGPARAALQQSRFTDVELIYTPSQIALACMRLSSSDGDELVGRYLKAKEEFALAQRTHHRQELKAWRKSETERLKKQGIKGDALPAVLRASPDEGDQDDVVATTALDMKPSDLDVLLKEIGDAVRARTDKGSGSVDEVKEIDKKLKQCANPERMPASRLVAKREADKQAAVLGKRTAARDRKTDGGGDANPFLDEDDEEDVENVPSKRAKTAATTSNGGAA